MGGYFYFFLAIDASLFQIFPTHKRTTGTLVNKRIPAVFTIFNFVARSDYYDLTDSNYYNSHLQVIKKAHYKKQTDDK